MDYLYFKREDFDCTETGENNVSGDLIRKVDELRSAVGRPLYITSGYRSPQHSLEAKKSKPGTHAQGIACDIAVANGVERRQLVKQAFYLGFRGIGVHKAFLHVDMRETEPVLWVY
jgi:zinc D-Ala-D-Ala carboxypeptidase